MKAEAAQERPGAPRGSSRRTRVSAGTTSFCGGFGLPRRSATPHRTEEFFA
ncbi:MAG: hypothetical protein M0C28_05155 [Candidatus Moduliflexus flocculans]|nr:hypothetical protein [Candidatus Moduliflexus flocculans]